MEEKVKYRYFATGRTGTRQLYPTNGQGLSVVYTESDDKLDYDVKISNKLKFKGADFFWLYALEKTIYRCEYIDILIEKYCSGAWGTFFKGRMSLNSGNPWNIDIGFVELDLAESQDYNCLDDGGDTDYNIFNYVSHNVTVKTISGTLQDNSETAVSTDGEPVDLFPGEPDPYSKGWVQRYIRTEYNYDLGNNGYTTSVIWTREVITVPVATLYPAPWVEVSNDGTNHTYARSPILYNRVIDSYDPTRPNDNGISYSVLSKDFDNGMLLKDVFVELLQLACPQLTIESDFFQWNPVNISNINYATESITKVNNLVLFQKSDIKRPDATSNANTANTNLNDLIKAICTIFQLKYAITTDGKFKIEHVDYFKDNPIGLDTTAPEYSKLTAGNRVYSYDTNKIPNDETFKFMDISYGDFGGQNITYSGSCAGQGDTKEIAYNVDNITTDVELCLNNPDPDSAVSDDGFVLIACDQSNSIIREQSIIGGNVLNNSLAWAQLQRDYYRYNRPQKTFMMNGVLTTALSVVPTKLQTDFFIPLCCQSFDPKLLVKTSLGDSGTVKGATYDMYNETLKLSILHSADDGLFENEAPITIGDSAETFKNTFVIIDVLANDSDPDGSIDPTTLAIVLQPANGFAEVTTDYKVKYTPHTDYVGSDYFIYNVKDNYKEPSANTVTNITVKDGTPTIQAHNDTYSIAKNITLNTGSPGVLANDTGPSALSAIAETKGTTAGGTVQIMANGQCIYTPPTDFVGADTFTYTAKDINNNMSIATVTVNVFTPSPVYVRLRMTGDTTPQSIVETCGGVSTITGQRKINDFFLDYYSDAGFTTPLNVNGYGLSINVLFTTTDYVASSSSSFTVSYSAFGSTQQIKDDYETEYQYSGCNGMSNINYDVSLSLQPGTGYNI